VFVLVLIAKLLIVINLLSDTNGCRMYILIFVADPQNYVCNNVSLFLLLVISTFHESKPPLVELCKTNIGVC
jgi:hypothetical protein